MLYAKYYSRAIDVGNDIFLTYLLEFSQSELNCPIVFIIITANLELFFNRLGQCYMVCTCFFLTNYTTCVHTSSIIVILKYLRTSVVIIVTKIILSTAN